PPNVCGDFAVGGGEECDDAPTASALCDTSCYFKPAICGDGKVQHGEECDDGNRTPGDGCENDCTATICPGAPLPPPAPPDVCATSPAPGAADGSKLFTGIVLAPGKVFNGGQVLVDAQGKIACVGCNCAAGADAAVRITCPNGVVSPGLINAHDHITFQG